jgi:hypothetical protein
MLCCAAAIAAFVAPSARADEWNKLTYLTFSGPVQVPGATLPAGTYMFRLADSMTNRHVVQVFDKEGKKLYATLLAIPDQRLDPSGQNIVLFAERPSGVPQAVKAWWYPGDTIGDEFVYPKSEAVKIARDTHQSVLAMDDGGQADSDHMRTAKVGRVDENGTMTDDDRPAEPKTSTASTAPSSTAAPQAQTAPAPATTAPSATGTSGTTSAERPRSTTAPQSTTPRATGTSGQTTTANANARNARRLPQTASNLPLVELLSGLAFAGAVGARQLRKRFADFR